MNATAKRLLKSGIKRGLMALSWPRGARTRILTYHSIGERRHDMTVSAKAFAAQLDWLAAHARVVSLQAALAGEPGVALTFDDGFADNLHIAAPMLAAHRFPATVFMVSGRAGGYLDDEPDPRHGRLMNWDEVRALRALGVDIGGHTVTHPHLSALDEAAQRDEIAGSKHVIESELGESISAFAYPYGSALDYTDLSMRLAREAGYDFACSNRYGSHATGDDPWQVRRIWIDATDTLDSFAAKVTGRLDALRLLDSSAGIRMRRWMQR